MAELQKIVRGTMEQVEAEVRIALSKSGFGVLTEIDISATLKEKLGVQRPPMKVLGACNPKLINQALEIDTSVALYVPCNVVLEEVTEGIQITGLDPLKIMSTPELETLGSQARTLLEDAITSVIGS
ncbi:MULTISPECIES: DUF302 domain-containing protein [Acidithrix]|nr:MULTISPECIES: DUF302 domain-containing protein [Acidithrix]CAG4917084.1 unnamed protein product [Acidithrix sp. C25]